LNSSICIISRASRHDAVPKLKFAGATNVIMPDTVGGNHMASLVTNPDLMEFLDVIRYEANQGINVKSLLGKELSESLVGRQVADIESGMLANCKIIGLKTSGGEYVVNPNNQLSIEEETRLFLLGDQQQILELEQMLKK
jgi:voltage-gated potassium channel